MKPAELADQCRKQIELAGEGAVVSLTIPGKWGRTDSKRLPGNTGPKGRILADSPVPHPDGRPRVIVLFPARELLEFVPKAMKEEGESC